jgi:deoxyhypusine synthase
VATTDQPTRADAGLAPVEQVEVTAGRSVSELLRAMGRTGFQGRALARAADVWERMIRDPDCTILFGYTGSLSTTGQYEIVNWLLENRYLDLLVGTGANLSEDIVDAMGMPYHQVSHGADDRALFEQGMNRYYDLVGHEDDYLKMTELIAEFYDTLPDDGPSLTTAGLLHKLGNWLNRRGIPRAIVATAARMNVPVFCPAIQDSPYGDAALLAQSHGKRVSVDAFLDYQAFMRMSVGVKATGVIYIGGGVPKDMLQLFAVTSDLLFPDRKVPGRDAGRIRHDDAETYYPHRYALQITTDSPQWGGLSGCTFDEAISWGKEDPDGQHVQCYSDATIALPILSQALAERLGDFRRESKLRWE